MADLTPEQQQEFEFRLRLEQEQANQQPQEAPKSKTVSADELVNPGFGMFGGAVGAQYAGPAIAAGYQEATKANAAKQLGVNPADLEWDNSGQRWARKTGYGYGEGTTPREVNEAFQKLQAEKQAIHTAANAPVGSGKISSTIKAGYSPEQLQRLQELEALDEANKTRLAEQTAKEAAALKAGRPLETKLAESLGMSPAVQNALGGVYKGVSKAVPAVVGRGLMGGLAGLQGFDAYNRFKQGDYAGALIGGLGTLGSAASFIPTPMTRIVGTGVGVGADLLNSYLDSLKKPHHAAGGQIAMAHGGLVYLR
jgi:hypothetical protein